MLFQKIKKIRLFLFWICFRVIFCHKFLKTIQSLKHSWKGLLGIHMLHQWGEGTVSNIYRMIAGQKYTLQYLNSLSEKNSRMTVADLAVEVVSHSFLKTYHDAGANVFLLADYTIPFHQEKLEFLSAYTGYKGFNHNFLLNLSLLRGMPLFLKPFIYRNSEGRWRIGDIYAGIKGFREIMQSVVFQNHYPKTLHVFHTNDTHSPYTTDQNCQRSLVLANTSSQSIQEERTRASYSYACTLKIVTDFLQKLKNQQIYDQTRIVIMADHGASRTGEAHIQYVPRLSIENRWTMESFDFNQRFSRAGRT